MDDTIKNAIKARVTVLARELAKCETMLKLMDEDVGIDAPAPQTNGADHRHPPVERKLRGNQRRCALPECHAVFVPRRKNQVFHSKACTSRNWYLRRAQARA